MEKEENGATKQSKLAEYAQKTVQSMGTENVHEIAASAVEDAEKTEPEDPTGDSFDEAHTMAIMMNKEDGASSKTEKVKSAAQHTNGQSNTKAKTNANARRNAVNGKATKTENKEKDT